MGMGPAANDSEHTVEQGGHPSARWSLHLLDGFALSPHPGGRKVPLPGKRERALLAYLALSPKGRQPRRKLAALLWGDATDETLLDNLRTCVWRLRKTLGDTDHRLLVSDEDDIVLDIAAFNIDVLAFRRLAEKTGRAELEAAAELCAGEFLSGLELDSDEFEILAPSGIVSPSRPGRQNAFPSLETADRRRPKRTGHRHRRSNSGT